MLLTAAVSCSVPAVLPLLAFLLLGVAARRGRQASDRSLVDSLNLRTVQL